jgi:hypothetical protein
MNYSELQLIIRYIRKTMLCNSCHKNYGNNDLEVLSTFDDQGLVYLRCPHCKTELVVHVTLSDKEAKITEKSSKNEQIIKAQRSLTERTHGSIRKNREHVTLNDVIDMHQFLNKFDGDFKELFSKQI